MTEQPKSFQSQQQFQIQLGQDINNAWQIVAARNGDAYLGQQFKIVFPIVRELSQWARETANKEDA